MNIAKLNPFVRSARICEVINRTDECRSYDSRLFYMISGDITVKTEEEKFHLESGNLVYIPAGMKYKLKGQYLRLAVIAFDPTDDWCDEISPISPSCANDFDENKCHTKDFKPFDKVLRLCDADGERENFIKMCDIATSAEGAWRENLSAMVKLVLLKLWESVSENALPSRMVESLDAYIRENCQDEISNTEIGAIFGYHPFYVSKLLKDKKGITLRQYIISYRIKFAKSLLESTNRSIAQIAEEAGFTDASYFTKTFKSITGLTPKEFRNQYKDNFI